MTERWISPRAIERLVVKSKRDLGHKELDVRVTYDARLTRHVGVAEWHLDARRPHVVRLSSRLWPLLSNEDRRETIVHELCHITVCAEMGAPTSVILPHDDLWHEHMDYLGYTNPSIHLVIDL